MFRPVPCIVALEFEISGENVIHKVVKVGPINQPLSLVAWVHGSPAELVISHLTFHEVPHRATHHRHWFLARQYQDLTHCINFHSLQEELACMGLRKHPEICVLNRKQVNYPTFNINHKIWTKWQMYQSTHESLLFAFQCCARIDPSVHP